MQQGPSENKNGGPCGPQTASFNSIRSGFLFFLSFFFSLGTYVSLSRVPESMYVCNLYPRPPPSPPAATVQTLRKPTLVPRFASTSFRTSSSVEEEMSAFLPCVMGSTTMHETLSTLLLFFSWICWTRTLVSQPRLSLFFCLSLCLFFSFLLRSSPLRVIPIGERYQKRSGRGVYVVILQGCCEVIPEPSQWTTPDTCWRRWYRQVNGGTPRKIGLRETVGGVLRRRHCAGYGLCVSFQPHPMRALRSGWK